MASGAITVGAATSDKADNGIVATLDNLDPITVLVWCRPDHLHDEPRAVGPRGRM
jgi:hypothetical protein